MTLAPAHEELRVRACELRKGDGIIVARNKAGIPTRLITVSTLVYGEGCKGFHVNPRYAIAPPNHPTPGVYTSMLVSCDGCYDAAMFVDVIRFSEDAQHV